MDNELSKKIENEAINSLKEERNKIEPIVAMNKEILNKIFEIEETRRNKRLNIDLIIGFVLGILSSLVAAMIRYVMFKRKRIDEFTAP